MSSSIVDIGSPAAREVIVTEDSLVVHLTDGRSIIVPLAWYPRLVHGSAAERANWQLIGEGEGIHWADLDEDISVAGILAGRRSGEKQTSLKQWLAARPSQAH